MLRPLLPPLSTPLALAASAADEDCRFTIALRNMPACAPAFIPRGPQPHPKDKRPGPLKGLGAHITSPRHAR